MNAKLTHELPVTVCFLSTFLFPIFFFKYKIRFGFTLVVKLMHLASVVLAANITWKFKMQLRRIFTYCRNTSNFLRKKWRKIMLLCTPFTATSGILCAVQTSLSQQKWQNKLKIEREKTYKENQGFHVRNIETDFLYIKKEYGRVL